MANYQQFETDRLYLKPTSVEDASFIYTLLNTEDWIKYIGDKEIRSIADAEEYIKNRYLPQLNNLGYSNYTIIRKSDMIKIGTCGLYSRTELEEIDIGFALLSEYRNLGYAFEAAHNLLNVAFDVFGLEKIYAIIVKENISSQKLLKRLGLKFQELIKLPNDHEELMLYSIKKEYLVSKNR